MRAAHFIAAIESQCQIVRAFARPRDYFQPDLFPPSAVEICVLPPPDHDKKNRFKLLPDIEKPGEPPHTVSPDCEFALAIPLECRARSRKGRKSGLFHLSVDGAGAIAGQHNTDIVSSETFRRRPTRELRINSSRPTLAQPGPILPAC